MNQEPKGQVSLNLMASENSESTVDRATSIMLKLLARVDKCCPNCRKILENDNEIKTKKNETNPKHEKRKQAIIASLQNKLRVKYQEEFK
jgi:hypothetical protein